MSHRVESKTRKAKPKYFRKLTKQDVINGLIEGKSVGQISRDFGYKSNSTIYKWKATDEAFAEDVDRLLASPQHRKRIALAQEKGEQAGDWRDRYLAYFRTHRDRVNAALFASKEPWEIAEALDPVSEGYDEEFAKRYENECLRIDWKIEDDVMDKASQGDQGMQRFWLQRKTPAQQVNVNHKVLFSAEGFRKAAKYIDSITLPAGELVESTE